MRSAFRFALLAAVAVSAVGCRFKGYEGFNAATSPSPASYDYTSGQSNKLHDSFGEAGVADSTGGLRPGTRYGKGAVAEGKPMPGYDQPQKGSGQQRGEYPNVAAAGHGQTNAPAFQPSPSDVGGVR